MVDAHLAHLEPLEPLDSMVNPAHQDHGVHPESQELHHHQSTIQLAPARAAPTDHPAHLAQLAQPDPTARRDPQATQAISPAPAITANPAHLVQLDSPVPLAILARLTHLARTDLREPREPLVHPDHQVQLDPRASVDRMAAPAEVEIQEYLDQLDSPDQPETVDHQARTVSLVHLDHLATMQPTAPAHVARPSRRSRRPKQHQINNQNDLPSGSALFYNYSEYKLGSSQFVSVLFIFTVLVNPKLALRSLN